MPIILIICSADFKHYFLSTSFSTSSQTILTTKLASCLHLDIIYSLVPSVIPFTLCRCRVIKFLIYAINMFNQCTCKIFAHLLKVNIISYKFKHLSIPATIMPINILAAYFTKRILRYTISHSR